jgi:hypothetical protein
MRAITEARVLFLQAFGREADPLEVAGAEVLHHGVGAGAKGTDAALPSSLLRIERDGQLVAAMHAEPDGMPILLRAPAAERVAFRRLHLDHLGAEVGQEAGAEGRRDVVAQLDHLQARQWQHVLTPARMPWIAFGTRAAKAVRFFRTLSNHIL